MAKKTAYVPKGIKLLVIITSSKNTDKLIANLATLNVYVCNRVRGKGTANQEVLDFLGIGESDKELIFCLLDEALIKGVMTFLKEDVEYVGGRRGIAFTMSLDSIASKKAIQEIVRKE